MQLHKLAIMQMGRYYATILQAASYIKLTGQKGLKSMQTPILLEAGVLQTQKMETVFYLELALLFVMQTVR